MLKLFVGSFTPKGIFNQKDASLKNIILYFMFLIMVISFPLNLQIIRSGGWDLYDFTVGIHQNYPDWLPSQLPTDIYISKTGMQYFDAEVSTFQTTNINGDVLDIIFAPVDTYEIRNRSLVFEPTTITYFNENGNKVFSVGYANIQDSLSFYDLQFMTQSVAIDKFTAMIDQAFSSFAIFKSVILYTGITLVLNLILVLIVSAIFIFVRIRFQRVTTFKQNIRIVIASMTLPSMLGFVIGVLEIIDLNAFSVVIFQLMTPLIALVSIYKGSKIKEISNRDT